MNAEVLVVGLGNELLTDEGLGVHVARDLLGRGAALRAGVEVLEAGTALLDALPELARFPRVILVDAVRAGGEPGTLYRVERVGESLGDGAAPAALSLHEWGVAEALRVARAAGLMPARVDLIGAEPERMVPGLELSATGAAAAERLVAQLLVELGPAPASG